jgi:hypothetical protein
LFVVAFAVGALPWYVVQFPGMLTLDSIAQLWQVSGIIPLDTWNPLLITLILKALHGRADIYVFLQYVVVSIIIGICYAQAAAGFGPAIARATAFRGMGLAFLAGLYPPIGGPLFYVIKDVPYAASLLLAAVTWAITLEREEFAPGRIFILGVLSGIPALFRHDGLLMSALVLAAGLIVLAKRRGFGYRFLLAGCVAVLLLRSGLPIAFQANTEVTRWGYALPFVRDLGGVVHAQGYLDDGDKQFLQNVAALSYLQAHFNPGFPDAYVFGGGVNTQWLADHRTEFAAGYVRIISRNLGIWLHQRLLAFLHFAGIRHQWINIGGVDCSDAAFPEFCARKIGPGTWFYNFGKWNQETTGARLVLWCSLWPIVGLIGIAVVAWKRRRPGILVFSLLPVSWFFCSAFIAVASYFRYNYYVLPFFIASLLAICVHPVDQDSKQELSESSGSMVLS